MRWRTAISGYVKVSISAMTITLEYLGAGRIDDEPYTIIPNTP